MLIAFLLCAVAAYAAAAGLTWRHLRAGASPWPTRIAAAAAICLHTLVLAVTMLHAHSVVIGVGGALSLFAWQAALLLWLFSLRQPLASLGLAVYPLAALGMLAAAALSPGARTAEIPELPLQIHILLSLLAYGLLTLAAAQALVLAIQHRQLHNHRPAGLHSGLPSLETMESLLFRLIAAGFFLLTLAIVSGAVFLENPFAQHLVHKTVLSLLAWVFFGVLLWGHLRHGWRGRLAVFWTAGG
ncbi:MAG: cytochrome c biogenesis protein CcsA, partial [Salinisphaera sp.]|nr:cytochrome c biogenesis protein CcsA [Salinisphaera sp.]